MDGALRHAPAARRDDPVRRIRIHLILCKALVSMPRKYAVRLLKLLLCQLHLFTSAVGIAVKGCHIELLLCLKIIHCVIHNVAHGLILRFAPRGIGGLCAVLCVVDDLLLGHVVHVGNGVVVMELHAGQADLGVLLHFLFQRNALAMAGAKGFVALVDVPRACGKSECCHVCILLYQLSGFIQICA